MLLLILMLAFGSPMNRYDATPDLKNLSIEGDSEITQSEVRNGRVISIIVYVSINGAIPTIGSSAFEDFSSLLSIHIPSSVKRISSSAFRYCTKLKTCTFSEGLEIVEDSVFFGANKLQSLEFPASCSSIQFSYLTYGCTDLNCIIFDKDNPKYTTDDNHQIVLTKDKTKAIICVNSPSSLALPSYVEILGSHFANNRLSSLNFYSDSRLRIVESLAFRQSQTKSIVFPSGLEEIHADAFRQSKIVNVTMSESLSVLNIKAFSQAYYLMNIFIPAGNKHFLSLDGVVYNSNQTVLIFIPSYKETITISSLVEDIAEIIIQQSNLESVEIRNNSVFSSYKGILYKDDFKTLFACPGKLIHARVHKNCTELKDYCFQYCSLQSIEFENSSIEKIGYMAFMNCEELSSFPFDNPLSSIGQYCFSGCVSLSGNVIFPSTLSTVSDCCFQRTNISLANFSLCSKLKEFPTYFFFSSKIEEIIFPPNLEVISSFCFAKCTSLRSLNFGDCLSEIQENAFDGCSSLSEVVSWGRNLKVIENEAFASTGLVDVEFPSGVEVVNTMIFANCKQLKTVTFKADSNMITVKIQAFMNTPSLHTINFSPKLSEIEVGIFFDTPGLKNVNVHEGNPKFSGLKGMLLSKDKSTLYACAGGIESISVPSTVRTLEPSAFRGCAKLKSVAIEESTNGIEEIPENIFYECISLENIRIPRSITYIHKSSFYGCSSLSSVVISKSSSLTSIEASSFKGCEKLNYFNFEGLCSLKKLGSECFFGCSKLKEFIFPPSTEEIGENCFSGCLSIECIRLPSNLSILSSKSFAGCDNINSITFCGAVPIGSENVFSEITKTKVPGVVVPLSYSGSNFCGIRVEKRLDPDCMVSSVCFTLGSDVICGSAYSLVGSISDSGNQ